MNHEIADLAGWQIDLRAAGYDGEFDYKSMRSAIAKTGWRFESLVQMPDKKDPDWPNYACRGTKGIESISSKGSDDLEALGNLLAQARRLK